MEFHVLPTRPGGAAENMAVDFLLLQRYPQADAVRFRHYDWRGPAFTFGYSQKIAFVRGQLPTDGPIDLCRRPTGGGVVDHRNDWTYALVLPRAHPLCDERAAHSYRVAHEGLAQALQALGQPAVLKSADESAEAGSGPGVCFQRAEIHDVIHPATGEKIAGAAQKRNKHGLLFQGSVACGSVRVPDWDQFAETFAANLARALGLPAQPVPWPEFNEDEVSGLTEHYASSEWIEQR